MRCGLRYSDVNILVQANILVVLYLIIPVLFCHKLAVPDSTSTTTTFQSYRCFLSKRVRPMSSANPCRGELWCGRARKRDIIAYPGLYSFICHNSTTWGLEIGVKKRPFLWHLQNSDHDLTREEALHFWHVAKRCIDHVQRSHYLQICYYERGAKHGNLPKQSALRTEQAVKCPDCDKLFTGISALIKHRNEFNTGTFKRGVWEILEWRPCQILSVKKKALFMIETNVEPYYQLTNSTANATAEATAATGFFIQLPCIQVVFSL